MVSRNHKRTAMYRSLQLLRSITKSHARRKSSVILEASNYIKRLKQKLEDFNQAVVESQNFIHYDQMPVLRVEEQEKGILIKVWSQKNCEGLLVFILEAFEELGLDVLQARVSCVDSFCLEAAGTKDDDNEGRSDLKAQAVEKVVFKAIQKWREVTKFTATSS